MVDKQELVIGLLSQKLAEAKVGILVKGISGILPETIAVELASKRNAHIYMAAVGYGIEEELNEATFTLTPSIEKAVLWRSFPEYAGNIIVFVQSDTDKLHSLAEFENLSLRDVSKYLHELRIINEGNTPTQNFWRALQQTSDYYSFDAILDSIPTIGGIFDDRTVVLESHQSDLRKLVGTVCNGTTWGGLMETEETVLKDAISSQRN